MDSLKFLTLDVFTTHAYRGNPLALVKIPQHLRSSITQEKKQSIAREFNLSETVFLHEKIGETTEWTIDIFTTDEELPFAGHPTIGAAYYVLNLHSHAEAQRLSFCTLITKAGPIRISGAETGGEGRVEAEIPHNVRIHKRTIADLEGPIAGLSSHRQLREAEMNAPVVSIVKGMSFLLVGVPSLDVLAEVKITGRNFRFHDLLDESEGWATGFCARYYYVLEEGAEDSAISGVRETESDVALRIRTRMLDVAVEDPATGSAACALASYLALNGRGTRKYEITQGVEMGRTSVISVEVVVDDAGKNIERLKLGGSAVQVMEGSLRI